MTQPFGYGYNYPFPLYGPSLPFYWQQPFYAPQSQVPPRYICEKDEEDEDKFICEVDPEGVPPPVVRQPVMYVRPIGARWFF